MAKIVIPGQVINDYLDGLSREHIDVISFEVRDGNVSFDWAASHNSHPNVVLEFQVQNAPSFEVELDDAVVSKETFDALAAICRQRTAEADKWHDIAILRESDITRLQCEITKRDEQIEQLIRDKATLVIEAARNAKPFWRKLW